MSSLIVASDLDLIMLEISIEELSVPRISSFDSALMKKTVVLFRLLDKSWTSILPQRSDYQVYRGSNSEIERFNGGVSVVFPIPQDSLDRTIKDVDLQIHVHRELSKYLERPACEDVGLACLDVSELFNDVIKGIKIKDAEIVGGIPTHPRKPVGRSSKATYSLLKEDGTDSEARLTVYLRITHLGRSVISEIEVPEDPARLFYAKEETSEILPYQCRELTEDELTGGCWGSGTLLAPRNPRDLMCCCFNGRRGGKGGKNGNKGTGSGSGTDGSGRDKDKGRLSDGNSGNKNGVGGKNGGDGTGKSGGVGAGGAGDDGDSIPCITKPSLCGKEGTCNKRDKKGKFGKCGKPDGEGGNPLACGERRKCARRKSASGSATVGIVDKKPSCPPRPVACPCPCPTLKNDCRTAAEINCPAPYATQLCTNSYQPTYYGSHYNNTHQNRTNNNLCQNYGTNHYGGYSNNNGWL
ncbi:uncharacterized protein LOC105684142 [Athalia rosae]|uniref:uncharacterized protein LOC105684142 n=1 Tax=Athalia rosae TaxID=37344 RepID=UPI0020342555|nr:uncharacterized protein LOC105684142 [Athalia rosae]